MTSPEKKVLKSKICCHCGIEKEIKKFYKNKYLVEGYEKRCKICRKKKLRCKKKKESYKVENPREVPLLCNVRKQDWVETFEFLKNIGYSLEKNIHEQFCEKYNLEPRKRMYDRSKKYSAKDLGLV